jgi:3-phenylpropionate/trans-cinnamate dioxygenase ferredoxin subunit
MPDWQEICALEEVAEDLPVVAEIQGEHVAIFRRGDRCFALRDVCSHAFARLSDGFIQDGTVECPLHGAAFDLETGKCVSTPPYDDVPCYEVRIDGGQVMVRFGAKDSPR